MKTSNSSDRVEPPTLDRPKMPARRSRLGQLWSDVLYVAKRDKKWWLMPLVVMLLILMALMIFAAAVGPLAPFIYPLL
jgi:Family of unknown function (DUF5989)